MALSLETSERNADARAVLARFYAARGRGSAQVIIEVNDDEAENLGLTYDRWLDAAERLFERGLLKRVGQVAYSIAPRGVDASEDSTALDELLPVLRGAPVVPAPETPSMHPQIAAALAEAKAAIARGEPGSAIDRVHTALHARVRELCTAHGVTVPNQASLPQTYSALCSGHASGAQAKPEGEKVLRSLGAVIEVLNTLRNHASLAHPGDLADSTDALLAINAAWTITAYIEARFA